MGQGLPVCESLYYTLKEQISDTIGKIWDGKKLERQKRDKAMSKPDGIGIQDGAGSPCM
jgi:hypothetical protein